MKSVVIFDFDGTLVDSFTMVVDIMYKLKPRWPILPKGEVERLRGMALLQVAQELRIPSWEIPFLLLRGRRRMSQMLGNVKMVNGMAGAVRALHEAGHPLYIVSSNSRPNIEKVLQRYEILDCFNAVHGSVPLLRKTRRIKHLARLLERRGRKVYYVGDEARDIRAAKAARVQAIAVAWGFNNIHILSEEKPLALVFDPADLIKLVK
jgi:phosphoglycolate phosphatase